MATDRILPKGEYIFREGESADYAYVLKDGGVEILKTGIDGEVILATLEKANTLFGEMALIDGAPRSAGARASSDTTVTEIQQDDFLQYVQKNPTAALNIMKNLSGQLREANKIASLVSDGGGGEISEIEGIDTEDAQQDHVTTRHVRGLPDPRVVQDEAPASPTRDHAIGPLERGVDMDPIEVDAGGLVDE